MLSVMLAFLFLQYRFISPLSEIQNAERRDIGTQQKKPSKKTTYMQRANVLFLNFHTITLMI